LAKSSTIENNAYNTIERNASETPLLFNLQNVHNSTELQDGCTGESRQNPQFSFAKSNLLRGSSTNPLKDARLPGSIESIKILSNSDEEAREFSNGRLLGSHSQEKSLLGQNIPQLAYSNMEGIASLNAGGQTLG